MAWATTEGYVKVPGGRVWYQVVGSDRPGVPLLCLHGGPGMPHDYLVAHVPMPREFLAAETDRYVVMPGQALAYLTGKLEILRIRDEARKRLGPAFSLPAFHGAVLDHGSLPMPTLARSIAGWLDQAG